MRRERDQSSGGRSRTSNGGIACEALALLSAQAKRHLGGMTADMPDCDRQINGNDGTRFVAYVYPGWHSDEYRPKVNEWKLLDDFEPRFAGHPLPLQPLGGRYDDSRPDTVARQMELASIHGVEAFSYFTYFSGDRLFLEEGMNTAFAIPDTDRRTDVCTTWCIRLPHTSFPVDQGEHIETAPHEIGPMGGPRAIAESRIENLTVRDVSQLVGESSDDPLLAMMSSAIRTVLASPQHAEVAGLLALAQYLAEPPDAAVTPCQPEDAVSPPAAASLRSVMGGLAEQNDPLSQITLKDVDLLVLTPNRP